MEEHPNNMSVDDLKTETDIPEQINPETTVSTGSAAKPKEGCDEDLSEQIFELRYEMIRLRRELKSLSISLNTINRPASVPVSADAEPKKKKSILTDIIFYVLMIALVVGAFMLRTGFEGKPVIIAGFSAFTVKTGSMDDVIPQGSLVVTRAVNASDLQIGDDITFLANETTTITHRIIRKIENYENTGETAFVTQGTMNRDPDKNPVRPVNIIGKVIFHNEQLGIAVTFIKTNWPLLIFAAVILTALFIVLRYTLRSDDKEKNLQNNRRRKRSRKWR